MTGGSKKDVARSIRHRLENKARSDGRPFQEVFEYYVIERFLYRLACSSHSDKFVLKGALMFTAWNIEHFRPTRDIDLLAHMAKDRDEVARVFDEVCRANPEPDGLRFDADSLSTTSITEDADYEGVRVNFLAYLGNARFKMQIDLGFGDVTVPAPQHTNYPTLLGHSPPVLRGYSRETVVTEKFEAMTKLGMLNSRMKDYFDLWLLSRQFDFHGPVLSQAIEATFRHRGTQIITFPVALSHEFADDATKQTQWTAFLRKSRLSNAPFELSIVADNLSSFLSPVADAVTKGQPFASRWEAPGPWA